MKKLLFLILLIVIYNFNNKESSNILMDSSNNQIKKEAKEIKDWDEGKTTYEKQQYLNFINKQMGTDLTINLLEKLSAECTFKIMGETIVNEDQIYYSKNRNECIKFMKTFYPKKIENTKKECAKENDDLKFKKYCEHFLKTYH